jgi:hypothetical protein
MKTKQKTIKIILSLMIFASVISCKEKVKEPVKEVENDTTIVTKTDSLKTPVVEEKKTDSELMRDILKKSK